MITEFFKQFYSSGDADDLVQFEVSKGILATSSDAKVKISDGNKNTVEMTIADFEHLQKLFKAYQDATDLIQTSLSSKND